MTPQRIQLRRTKGWRKPEGAVVVARPSKWGNPWRWENGCSKCGPRERRRMAVQTFDAALSACMADPYRRPFDIEIRNMADSLDELRGRDLACWCPLDQPCHADILLKLANP